MDLNKLRDWARENAVSLTINYWESCDQYEIEVVSAAKSECYYEKKAISAESFIQHWEEHVKKGMFL